MQVKTFLCFRIAYRQIADVERKETFMGGCDIHLNLRKQLSKNHLVGNLLT